MAHQENDTELFQVYDVLVDAGFYGLADALLLLLNEVTRLERSQHRQAQPNERSEQRRGYANGYKPKRARPHAGELDSPRKERTKEKSEAPMPGRVPYSLGTKNG